MRTLYLNPLHTGGTIGIMAPSSAPDAQKLEQGVRYLEGLGYRVDVSPGCYSSLDYLAGDAAMRSREFMRMVESPHIDAIFFARGGFGSTGMLAHIDYEAVARAGKLMVGYSDITAIQWAVFARCRLPSLSAGMPATDFCVPGPNAYFEEQFWKTIESGRIDTDLQGPHWPQPGADAGQGGLPDNTGAGLPGTGLSAAQPTQGTILDQSAAPPGQGTITGLCLPGTLSVAAKLVGTPYLPDLAGTIAVFEDVAEPRHKIEGYFWQLAHAGCFDNARALVLGHFTPPEQETFSSVPTLQAMLGRIPATARLALFTDLAYGHIDCKIPVPVGREISLSWGASARLTSTEPLYHP